MHDRTTVINVREYNKFIDTVLDSILQFIFKKAPFVEFWFIQIYQKLCLQTFKLLLFPTTYL